MSTEYHEPSHLVSLEDTAEYHQHNSDFKTDPARNVQYCICCRFCVEPTAHDYKIANFKHIFNFALDLIKVS